MTTPSVVSYDAPPRGATVVGAAAAALRAVRPQHTVHDAKRLIGRTADDPVVLAEAAHLPFAVVPDARGFAAVALPHAGGGAPPPPVTPEAVGAALLRHLKAAAERSKPLRHALGFRFGSATISVPVAFSTRQRAATLAAGRAAGFRLVRLLDEPVAAALAYGLTRADKERTVLVYDMGGGTLDVAILRLELASRTFLVMAAAGDPHLGGEDFDRALAVRQPRCGAVRWLRTSTADVFFLVPSTQAWAREAAPDRVGDPADGGAAAALLVACEAAKRALGTGAAAALALPRGGELTLTRAAADAAVTPLLERALQPGDAALREAGLGADDVDDVVLVGGATRLQALRERVGEAFHGRALHTEVDPDTAIAVGAARAYNC